MIRSKITERMDGRAGWLRRAFVDFDTDGSGSISFDEFIAAVEFKTVTSQAMLPLLVIFSRGLF